VKTRVPPELPPFELAYPGPLRDDEPLPVVGQRYVLVDSDSRPVGVVKTTEVRIVTIDGIDLDIAREEGEGYELVASWREAHERFWTASVPGITIDDATVVAAERFRLVERLDPDA